MGDSNAILFEHIKKVILQLFILQTTKLNYIYLILFLIIALNLYTSTGSKVFLLNSRCICIELCHKDHF